MPLHDKTKLSAESCGLPVAVNRAPLPSELRQPACEFAGLALPHGQAAALPSPAQNGTPGEGSVHSARNSHTPRNDPPSVCIDTGGIELADKLAKSYGPLELREIQARPGA